MIKPKILALAAVLVAVAAPSTASACDLDGFDGMHRLNPFGGMAFGKGYPMGSAAQSPAPAPAAEPAAKKDDSNAKRKAEAAPEPIRQWEEQGNSEPISREDMSTFT